MSISDRQIPSDTKIIICAEPVLNQPGVVKLSPKIASVFARWSSLEKDLDLLFTLVTNADQTARMEFDRQKGWDRRVDKIEDEAKARLEPATADVIRIVLRLVKKPACKRDELAHRVWAVAEGFEDDLALLRPDAKHILGQAFEAVKKAGTCNADIDSSSIYEGSFLVSGADLDRLISELEQARDRMECLINGFFYPAFADRTGNEFSTFRHKLDKDVEISERVANSVSARRKVEKTKQRARRRD